MRLYIKLLIFTIFFTINSAHADDLNKIVKERATHKAQDYFNKLESIEADFNQTDTDGNDRTGKFLLSRPNKMRIDYYTPEKEMILLDEDFLIHYNRALDEVSYVSNDNLPISLLSRQNLDFTKDVRVINASEQKEGLSIELLLPKSKNDEHRIVMYFTNKPFQLSRITVLDKNGSEVTLSLVDAKYNQKLPASAFEFKNPKFFR